MPEETGFPPALSRHDLCWLRQPSPPLGGVSILTVELHPSRPEELVAIKPVVMDWIATGRPFVATRQEPTSQTQGRKLALCRPRSDAPRRVALEVDITAILKWQEPVPLHQARAAAPVGWQPILQEIDRVGADLGLTFRVFGSLAWQALTGLPYLHAASDVDLLLDLPPELWRRVFTPDGQLSPLLREVGELFSAAPFRCDCELRLARGPACSFGELRNHTTHVLLRHNDRNTIHPRPRLRELAA